MEGVMSDLVSRAIPKINGFSLERPRLLPVLTFTALLLAVSLFFVWSRLQVTNLEYDISSLEGQVRVTRQETRRLQVEAASLRSPERIEQIARTELGLHLPSPDQILTVR
jgi:cell division protein FtsL